MPCILVYISFLLKPRLSSESGDVNRDISSCPNDNWTKFKPIIFAKNLHINKHIAILNGIYICGKYTPTIKIRRLCAN